MTQPRSKNDASPDPVGTSHPSNAEDSAFDLGTGDLPSPEEALAGADPLVGTPLLSRLRGSRVLFYPGAGMDVTPALRFARSGAVDAVVYCDYLYGSGRGGSFDIEEVFQKLEKSSLGIDDEIGDPLRPPGNQPRRRSRYRRNRYHGRSQDDRDNLITAAHLGQNCRADFFPNDFKGWGSKDDDASDPVIGAKACFVDVEGEAPPLHLFYLCTEAIQTYIHLWGNSGHAPFIVVVQNHGKGGLWTRLCGDCLLYAAAPKLPPFIYVGDISSEPWPNYRQISKTVVDPFSMHKSKRSLYKCTIPSHINPDSPLAAARDSSEEIDPSKYDGFSRFKIS